MFFFSGLIVIFHIKTEEKEPKPYFFDSGLIKGDVGEVFKWGSDEFA